MCTNFTPTKRAQWVKGTLGVDLPTGYQEESYPGFSAPIVVKSHLTERVACGLARFGLIPTWAKDDKISRHTYNALSEGQKSLLLQRIPVEEVGGVGRKLTKRLECHRIRTVQDLKQAHVPTLRAEFGVVMEKIQPELQEVSCIELQEIQPDRQQIIASRSFGKMVSELPILQDALSTFVVNACVKLRGQGSHAAVIQVFLQTNRFRKDLPQYMPSLAVPLPHPTNDSLEVNRWASFLCERMFKPEYQYKKTGIMLSEISLVTHRQGDLLEGDMSSNGKLMLALDTLNQRFGRGTVKVSTQGAYQDWQMRQESKSPNYTSDWDEVPMV